MPKPNMAKKANEAIKTSFETLALPVANRKHMGVIAMKVMAQDALIGPAEPAKLMYYSLSLPVTAVVIGMPKFEHIEENCRLAKAFKPAFAKPWRPTPAGPA